MPWKIIEEDGRHCVWKEDADGKPTEKLKCYDNRDDALAYQRALYANTADAQEGTTDQFIALASYDDTGWVEFLRTGVFTDARGNEVEITPAHLDALVLNFETGAAGQDVPIDVLHERREAAGWVQELKRKNDLLLARVAWNELGRSLVGDKVYRYLSATIDLTRNVLKSISLVNFPAVKGLRPAELAEPPDLVDTDEQSTVEVGSVAPPSQPAETPIALTANESSTPMEVEKMSDEKQVVEAIETAQPTTPASAVLTEADVAALRKAVEAEVRATLLSELEQIERSKTRVMAELMEQVREERALSEFTQMATGEGRFALPVKRDELHDLLMGLPKPHRTKVIDLLRTVVTSGTVDFTEHGTGRGSTPKRPDADLMVSLRRFVNAGGKVETFFEANPDLGAKSEYDLSEFGG